MVSIIVIASILDVNDDDKSVNNFQAEDMTTTLTSQVTTMLTSNITEVTIVTTQKTSNTTTTPTTDTEIAVVTSMNTTNTTTQHINILMQSDFKIEEDDDIKYGYINISKNDLLNITEDDFKEFANTIVANNTECDWITIICDDGTGVHFTGNDTTFITYGKMFEYGSGLLGNTEIYILQNYGETNYYTSIVTTSESETVAYDDYTYVVNTKTKKYHKPNCSYANKINYENKDYLTISEITSQGYSPCEHCKP
ncbi:MAG: hypothetical protein KH373_01845 [Ruminococcus sp.]|nr:hypothetical protein [Ruminococcus sp.]